MVKATNNCRSRDRAHEIRKILDIKGESHGAAAKQGHPCCNLDLIASRDSPTIMV